MKTLFILNDAPYGSERTYNGLRLAGTLAREQGNEVRIFLIGDAASAAHGQQKTPTGYYNIETMLTLLIKHGGVVGVCGSCMDARGIATESLIAGAHRSSMDELAQWTAWADKALVF
ncbi:DsrE/DsrF/TusD sulfur relay family protein [Noviherbaspirillum pedocola]|uniref:DsrE family protein n=1 Tax=Noviherbaspirillum pedocola TaxID=2801341 RepID=A0A934W6Q8_9BURK|nr:DsrE family protein [Noviherbaspirillum pedocola]MBK4734668.1 DsrE family protein [Noviherbaspirillum pedocola]